MELKRKNEVPINHKKKNIEEKKTVDLGARKNLLKEPQNANIKKISLTTFTES